MFQRLNLRYLTQVDGEIDSCSDKECRIDSLHSVRFNRVTHINFQKLNRLIKNVYISGIHLFVIVFLYAFFVCCIMCYNTMKNIVKFT